MKKICRVCGKSYDACKTPNITGGFRWRDVACSPECGAEYLRRVMEARAAARLKNGETKDIAATEFKQCTDNQ